MMEPQPDGGLTVPAETLFRALVERDPAWDGAVYYGITTTGIFCRSTCPARKPKFENVRYFATVPQAMAAGYRPCKLCHPLAPDEGIPPAYRDLLGEIAAAPAERIRDQELRERGIDPDSLRRWCRKRFGITFQALARASRLARAFDAIHAGQPVVDAAMDADYEGPSGFGETALRATGRSPKRAATAGTLWMTRFETPLGTMVAGEWRQQLCLLEFADRRALPTEIAWLEKRHNTKSAPGRTAFLDQVEAQVREYFTGARRGFDLPLLIDGTPFQQAVWRELLAIPYGETRSYGRQAEGLGRPEAVRAVASANGKNRIAVVIPCHRVVGADGSLTGYAGGLPRKQALLDLESGRRPPWPG
jgi:AraC family transcriptional regulator of adaptative response/methylated-DNA-[protein]-cysteine methyltransferase